ncbi:MAG: hypothetical protein ACYDAG_11800 [Chloroflexota bacterium]
MLTAMYYRPTRRQRHDFWDADTLDWLMADPLAAAEFLRRNRVQVLDGATLFDPMEVMVLTRDSLPGLGLSS